MSYLSTDEAYEYADLACWYQDSIDQTKPPIWTDEHLEELLNDFYVIPKDTPTADVVPKSEAFLASSDAMKMLLEVHGYAVTHDEDIKREVAREIFEEIERLLDNYHSSTHLVGEIAPLAYYDVMLEDAITELKKKYTEGER